MSKAKKAEQTPVAGLFQFYSSEAKALLEQYKRIDYLLGKESHDHTHTGNLCEVLIRGYLRRVLLPGMGVDKGFVFVKSPSGEDTCSPEIDILVHDQSSYRPIYRQDEFVIVQPEAVLGLIQIKKKFRTGSNKASLVHGIRNVIQARLQIMQHFARNETGGIDWSRICQGVFSAVVGFEGSTQPKAYWKNIADAFLHCCSKWEVTSTYNDLPATTYALPNFVGTLQTRFCVRSSVTERGAAYQCHSSEFETHNICLQVLALVAAEILWNKPSQPHRRPPFRIPDNVKAIDEHWIAPFASKGKQDL